MTDNIIKLNDYREKPNKENRSTVYTDEPNALMLTTKTDIYAFFYKHLQHVGIDNKTGDIDINFTIGKIVIKGKNLDQLFMDIRHQKAIEVNINNEGIEDIQVILHRDYPHTKTWGLNHERTIY